jgi:adenylate cyclase
MYGELVPVGGGDTIPLIKETLVVGRRESCDIVLRFANVSGQHCQLSRESGYWFVQDLNSQNGVKVNGSRVIRKRLDPGDLLSMARHKYTIQYTPEGPPPSDEQDLEAVLSKSLLDRAGLQKRAEAGVARRYNPMDNDAGQLKRREYE